MAAPFRVPRIVFDLHADAPPPVPPARDRAHIVNDPRSHHIPAYYFDPSGARRLSRTLSHIYDESLRPAEEDEGAEEQEEEGGQRESPVRSHPDSISSNEALAVGDDFDFARLVRQFLKKCVLSFSGCLILLMEVKT